MAGRATRPARSACCASRRTSLRSRRRCCMAGPDPLRHLRRQPARGRRRHEPLDRRLEPLSEHAADAARRDRRGLGVRPVLRPARRRRRHGRLRALRRPAGRARRAIARRRVLPTNTWQAYNFWDADGNGWGDTWYAGFPNKNVALSRPFLRRGVPPFFYRYDQGFLHWLSGRGKTVDFLAESDLDDALAATSSPTTTTCSSSRDTAST